MQQRHSYVALSGPGESLAPAVRLFDIDFYRRQPQIDAEHDETSTTQIVSITIHISMITRNMLCLAIILSLASTTQVALTEMCLLLIPLSTAFVTVRTSKFEIMLTGLF